jgi:hypothetical protein
MRSFVCKAALEADLHLVDVTFLDGDRQLVGMCEQRVAAGDVPVERTGKPGEW